jgi:hypothetical protein
MALVEEAVDEDEDDVAAGVHPASGGVCFRKTGCFDDFVPATLADFESGAGNCFVILPFCASPLQPGEFVW